MKVEGRDPVIDEVRAIRGEYAESLGNDLAAIISDLQRREAEHPEAVVTLTPKRVRAH